MIKPLNSTKTHPLTPYALGELRGLLGGPCPTQEFNAGVVNRLAREDLVRIVMHPSPYKTHNGKLLAHLEITDAGRARLEAK